MVVLFTLTWSGGSSLFLGLTYTVTGAVTWLASSSMMAVSLGAERKENVLPPAVKSSLKKKKKAKNTEMDSEVTKPEISDEVEMTGMLHQEKLN